MTAIGDVVGVEVADPFNPDDDPIVCPGLVVNVEARPKGEEGKDVVTAVVYARDGSTTVRQVSEGGGLTTLSKGNAKPDKETEAGEATP